MNNFISCPIKFRQTFLNKFVSKYDMVKKLPQVKKGLKEFILDEDAKVIDRTATKIAVTSAFIAVSISLNSEDANAKGHSDHSDHSNNLNAPNNFGTGIHGGTNPTTATINEISDKSVETMHSNHYNHQDQSGGQGFSFIGFIVAAVAAAAGGAGAAAGAVAFLSSGTGMMIVGGAGLAGGILGGELGLDGMGGEGEESTEIDTGSPHFIPEPVLQALKEEEEN